MDKLLKRNEIPESYKWKLEDIYETEILWEEDFSKVKELSSEFEKMKGKIANSSDTLLFALKLDEKISLMLEKLYVYSSMRRDEDARDPKYQGMLDRASTLNVDVSSKSSFFIPEVLEINVEILNGFYKENEKLHFYKKFLEDIRRQKKHILSKEEEMILTQFGEISSSASTIFGMINNADMKFGNIIDENGNEVELTKGNYSEFMDSQNRSIRKNAFETMYRSYIAQKNTIGATLAANVKKNVLYAKIRKYPSALEKSLFSDDVPVDVYHNLINTVKENVPAMEKYLKIRKKILNLDKLHMYDLYVPLIGEADLKITYDEAYETMKKGLSVLGKDYIDVLEEAKNDRWIDVLENEGKRGGAYAWGSYGTHPFVLLNHKNNLDSMFTLAHEMGHAMHSYLSDANNSYLYAQYTIFVAEVASTVNEALLMQYLLKNTTDKKMKMYLINHFLEQFRGTIYRQTMFAEFEYLIHQKSENGDPLTAEVFSEIYLELNKKYYGNEVILDNEIAMEWARIPHFYTSFYVYKYATGFSAAIALSKAILEEGETARNRYLEFLKSGGSDYPIELLKKAGVDMTSPKPIQDALNVFRDLVDELERLYNEK